MANVELLDTFHTSVGICSRISYKKNVTKSYIIASLAQWQFLWRVYLNFEEIFYITLSFLHFIFHFLHFIVNFHNTSQYVFTTTIFS